MRVEIDVNGKTVAAEVEARLLLVQFIRDVAGLKGTNIGCDTTSCGACTVLLDGQSVKSCTVLAAQADGTSVTTIEGLAPEAGEGSGEEAAALMHPVQRAFHENHGLQCGYCTPGLLLSTHQLLSGNPEPSEKEIRKAIAGNTCRCTGYMNIFKAIQLAGRNMKGA